MARILAIDYGTKRVGIAVSDPLQIFASGLATVRAHDALDFLNDYFLKEKVECVVIGHPKKMNNQDSDAFHFIKLFEKNFKNKFPLIPVILVDERFTSLLAREAMLRGGMKKKERQIKSNLDKISAAIILQSYLDSKIYNR